MLCASVIYCTPGRRLVTAGGSDLNPPETNKLLSMYNVSNLPTLIGFNRKYKIRNCEPIVTKTVQRIISAGGLYPQKDGFTYI